MYRASLRTCFAHPSCIKVEGVSWRKDFSWEQGVSWTKVVSWRKGHAGSMSIYVACGCSWGILRASRVK
jgi:hypothetical protein